jgi:hypothetical protein
MLFEYNYPRLDQNIFQMVFRTSLVNALSATQQRNTALPRRWMFFPGHLQLTKKGHPQPFVYGGTQARLISSRPTPEQYYLQPINQMLVDCQPPTWTGCLITLWVLPWLPEKNTRWQHFLGSILVCWDCVQYPALT